MNMKLPNSFNGFNVNQNYDIKAGGNTIKESISNGLSYKMTFNYPKGLNVEVTNFFNQLATEITPLAQSSSTLNQNNPKSLGERLSWLGSNLDIPDAATLAKLTVEGRGLNSGPWNPTGIPEDIAE